MGWDGGTILILLLSLFLDMNQHEAQAANLIFFIPTSLTAIFVNIRQKNIDYKLAGMIIFFGIFGAIIGALFSRNITSNSLRKIFAVFILVIAIHEMYDLYKEYKNISRIKIE